MQINNQIIPPIGEARSNYWVFREIAPRMGYTEPCFSQTEEQVIEESLEGTGFRIEELKQGPVLCSDPDKTSFDDGRFPTPSGKLKLTTPSYTPVEDSAHPYRLITPKTKHLQSSRVFDLPRKWASIREPSLFIHPDHAAVEGIDDGDLVRAWNERAEVQLVARL